MKDRIYLGMLRSFAFSLYNEVDPESAGSLLGVDNIEMLESIILDQKGAYKYEQFVYLAGVQCGQVVAVLYHNTKEEQQTEMQTAYTEAQDRFIRLIGLIK